jgi:hypothetical protein
MAHAEELNENDYDGFLGIGKKAKARKAVRVENRKEKKAVRLDNKKSKVENRRSKAQSRVILAEQGISTPSALGEVAGGLGGLIKNITGGGGGEAPAPTPVEAPAGTPPILMPSKVVEPVQAIGAAVQGVKTAINEVFGDTSDTGTYSTKPQKNQRPAAATEPYVSDAGVQDVGGGDTAPTGATAKPESKMKKYMPLIIGGIVLVVVVVLVVVFKKKK